MSAAVPDKSSRIDIPIEDQRRAWNDWNTTSREVSQGEPSRRQAQLVERWLNKLSARNLRLLDAGCGAGWMCQRLVPFGEVTGIDLADEVLERARQRLPSVQFISGSLMSIDLEPGSFDVVVCLEVLSHLADQQAFVRRLASVLKPGGHLMLATQNRPVLERWSAIGGPIPGQIRRWVDAPQLRRLLADAFEIEELTSVLPVGDTGYLRIVNSWKLNRLLEVTLGAERTERFKERLLFGHTLMVHARRRCAVQS